MPKIVRDTTGVNYEEGLRKPYAGPTPPQGTYDCILQTCEYKQNKAKTGYYYNILAVLNTKGVEGKEQYDGFPAWVMLSLTNKEANLNREQAYYAALGAGLKPEVIIDDKGQVTKIGGKKPTDVHAKVFIKHEVYEGQSQAKGDTIYPAGDVTSSKPSKPASIEEQYADDEDVVVESAVDEVEEVDLDALTLPQLRELAKSLDIVTGRKKPETLRDEIQAIWDAEEEEEEPEEPEDEPEEAEAEATVDILTPKDAEAMNIIKLRAFAVESGFEKDDLKGLSKAEIIELLTDEGLVAPF